MGSVLILLVAAVALATAWAGPLPLLVFVGALLVPYGLVWLSQRRGWPGAVALAALLAAAAGGVVWVGAAAGLSPGSVVFDAVPRLLTAPRPAPAGPDLLVPGALLCLVVGAWVGLRSGRGGGGAAPLLGAAVLYTAGALLTAGQGDPDGWLAVAIVALAVLGWAGRESTSRGRRVLARSVPVTAVGLALCVVAAVAVPSAEAFEPRQLVQPPPLPLTERNPLPWLAGLTDRPDVELFRYQGSARGERLHLVSLDDFDGATWQDRGRYRPIGVVPPAVLPPGPNRHPVAIRVTISALDGVWLPAPGQPTAVSIRSCAVDAQSGAVALADGLRPGLRYDVRAFVEAPRPDGLANAGITTDPLAEPYRGVPRLPYVFAQYAQQAVQGASSPFEQAVLLERAVRTGRRFDPDAAIGSSYARLATFLIGRTGEPGAQVGRSEQFAAAFAVLARAMGLPSRLTVGFEPGTRGVDGTWVVRGRDALVWPEVYFAGQGWVAFDPTPSTQDSSGVDDAVKRQVLDQIARNQAMPAPTALPAPPPGTRPGALPPGAAPSTRPLIVTLAELTGVTIGLLLALVLLGRRVRRVRHRRAGPRGAWSEVLDFLTLADRPPLPSTTARRIAEDLAIAYPTLGVHPALRLAAAADRAAFAPAMATLAAPWSEVRRLRQLIKRRLPWYRRLTWPVDPRPLRR